MIKISPFSPLFFYPSTDEYGVDSRYLQVFAPSDKIVIQVLADEGESVTGKLNNVVKGTSSDLSFTKYTMSSGLLVYTAIITNKSEGYYSVNINGNESNIFHITGYVGALSATSLISYTSNTNKHRKDVVFVTDTQYEFQFRVPGGFKDGDWAFEVNNEQFDAGDGNIIELYAIESTQKTFTMGNAMGCPIWFGELLNRLLCATHVHINGVRYIRKGNSAPEVTQEIPSLKSYIFKVQLQGMIDNIDIELPSSDDDSESESEGGGAGYVYLIKVGDETRPTDSNTFSALRMLMEVQKVVNEKIADIKGQFLLKDEDDSTTGIITFLNGVLFGNQGQGVTVSEDGNASAYLDTVTALRRLLIGDNGHGIVTLEDGTTQAVVDRLYVKIKAYFDALEVKKKTYVGGEQILSPAGMKCIRVEELDSVYRCYFRAEEDGVEIENTFVAGQLAICQECNVKVGVSQHVGNRFYWRKVDAVGSDYIDLSKTECAADSDVPAEGDDIVALGHKDDIVRQSAIIMSSVAATSPSIIFYQGIKDFSLDGHEVIVLEYDRTSGHARMKVYGETYIGDKNGDSYISYDPVNGLQIRAKKIMLSAGNNLDDKLSALDKTLKDMDDSLSGMDSSISEMGEKVDGMGDTVNEIDGTVDELSNQVGNLDEEVTNLGLSVESTNKVVDTINRNMADISGQLDGSIKIWQGDYSSLEDILIANKVPPSSDWTTDALMNEHLGDYLVLENGMCYELEYDMENYRYIWKTVSDKYLIAYLRSLDKKKAIFKITDDSLPMTFFSKKEYAIGDLWVNATYPESGEVYNDETLVCITPKSETEQFDITHWVPADGTKKKLLDAGINIENREIQFTAEQFKFRNLLGDIFTVLEEVDGVPTIRAELLQITGALIAEKIMASGLDIDGKFVVTIGEDGKATVKLTGEIDATSGTLGSMNVNGALSVKAGDVEFLISNEGDYPSIRGIFSGEEKVLIGVYNSNGNAYPRISVKNNQNQQISMESNGIFFLGDGGTIIGGISWLHNTATGESYPMFRTECSTHSLTIDPIDGVQKYTKV